MEEVSTALLKSSNFALHVTLQCSVYPELL